MALMQLLFSCALLAIGSCAPQIHFNGPTRLGGNGGAPNAVGNNCPAGQYSWTFPGSRNRVCGNEFLGTDQCPKLRPNMRSFLNKTLGTGLCDCKRGFLYWPKDDRCYVPLTRGPCRQGNILYYDTESQFLACQKNPCDQEGFGLWSDGECYQIGEPGPCAAEGQVLDVDSDTFGLSCVDPEVRQIINVLPKCPVGSKRDVSGVCGQTTSVGGSVGSGCEKGFIRKPNGSCVKWFR